MSRVLCRPLLMTLVVVMALWETPFAQGPEFRMNMSAPPLYGWSTRGRHTTAYTHTHLSNGGPSGGPAVRIDMAPLTTNHPTCDPAVGFEGAPGPRVPSQGGSVFFRYYVKYSTVNPSRNSGCGGGPWEGKMVITGGADGERVIEQAGQPQVSLAVKLAKNINTSILPNARFVANRWHALEWEVKTGSGNGVLAYRLDNDSATPTATGGGWTFNVGNWGGTGAPLGVQFMAAVHANGTSPFSITVGCFEVDDQRDATFFSRMTSGHPCAGGSTPPPPPPPPPPGAVDCQVSAWSFQSASAWSPAVCPTSGQQTRTETWSRVITTAPANGGAACPALTETLVASRSCQPSLPPPAGACLDGATVVPSGSAIAFRLTDSGTGETLVQQLAAITARFSTLRAAGFDVALSQKSSYTQFVAWCGRIQ